MLVRNNSDYINKNVDNLTPSGSSSMTSHLDPLVARKIFYDRLSLGSQLCNQELYDNALIELKALE
jgi:hypothetical protein